MRGSREYTCPRSMGSKTPLSCFTVSGGAIERAHQLFAFDVLLVAVHTHAFSATWLWQVGISWFFMRGRR